MAGALAHVGKYESVVEFRDAVRSAARGEMYLTPDVADILSASSSIPALSPRELSALQMYAAGLTMARVAEELQVSPHTAREYIDRVRDKYALKGRTVRTRTELYVAAVRDGFLSPAT
jgi:DNA-binding NarL/FixJ family response regulator